MKIGIQLPVSSNLPEEDYFSNEDKKKILLNIKPTAKNEVKEILNRLSIERKNILIEKNMMQRELEAKIVAVNEMDSAVKVVKQEIQEKGQKIKNFFEKNLLMPFNDIWDVYNNIDQNSAVQLFIVFKMHSDKIKDFVEKFPVFQF